MNLLRITPSAHRSRQAQPSIAVRGFTLAELLVAATIALIAMGTLATLLGLFTRSATYTQNVVALTHKMRTVGYELRRDLAGVTCKVSPPLSPESDSGYFEIIEGPMQDALTYDSVTRKEFAKPYTLGTPLLPAERFNTGTNGRLLGDVDDVLALTTRSLSEPFSGRCYLLPDDTTPVASVSGAARFTMIQSRTAEVVWFCQKSRDRVDGFDVYDLHRRQLLVLPYVGARPFVGSGMSTQLTTGTLAPIIGTIAAGVNQLNLAPWTLQSWSDFFGGLNHQGSRFYYDVSVRRVPFSSNNFLVPNSLGDLTKRENRYWRWDTTPPSFASSFPFPFLWGDDEPSPGFNPKINPKSAPAQTFYQETIRQGEDVVLSNVIGFDVRVFDPDAPIKLHPSVGTPLIPGDPGYNDSAATLAVTVGNRPARGAYVDLGWDFGNSIASSFVFPINPPGSSGASGFANVFPGSEDRHTLINPGGPDDSNNNSRLDTLTSFQGIGMQPANKPISYSGTPLPPKPPVSYCTWSTHYESNGIDEDGDGRIDEGNDGVDDNGDGIVDDPAERETSAPYPVPLRGVEIRIRCIEPTTKEIRQITIRHAFEHN